MDREAATQVIGRDHKVIGCCTNLRHVNPFTTRRKSKQLCTHYVRYNHKGQESQNYSRNTPVHPTYCMYAQYYYGFVKAFRSCRLLG